MTHDGIATDGRQLLLAYYGDDFTGSTDVMEVMELAGIPTELYLDLPTPTDIARDPTLRAIGVAGASRTWSVEQMDRELPRVFAGLTGLGARTVHYKVCSTFDSSPSVGSIGRALEIARSSVTSAGVPMVIGSPDLGRYCLFGELYARAAGRVHRLDRHPTLPDHPITPMREADLLRHLRHQTDLPTTSIDVLALDGPWDALEARYQAALRDAAVILFDVLRAEHLPRIGRLMWAAPGGPSPCLVGSSGIESALIAHWREQGWLRGPGPHAVANEAAFQLVLSGSCSEATRTQLDHAAAAGYTLIRLPSDGGVQAVAQVADDALAVLERGRSAAVFTALGPTECVDPTVSAQVGERLADVAAAVLTRVRPPRFVVTGGDTSGRVATRLGIDALRFVASIAPGAPLCRARARDQRIDGLEIALKGGQVGGPAYLEQVRRGRP